MGEITNRLEEALVNTKVDKIDEFMDENWGDMLDDEHAFTKYMRETISRKQLQKKDVYIAAGLSEKEGNDAIALRKHKTNRDVVIRICLGAHFSLDETNRALKLHGMSPLYSRDPRDAVLIIAISHGIFELSDIDEKLEQQGFKQISFKE